MTWMAPPLRVNSIIRRRTRTVQSRFSVGIVGRFRRGAGVHRDERARRRRQPLDTKLSGVREVDGRDQASALGLGQRAHAVQRVREHEHTLEAFGDFARRRLQDAEDDAGRVAAEWARHRHREPALAVEIVFVEATARPHRLGPGWRRVAVSQAADDLIGVGDAVGADRAELELVGRGGPNRLARR